MKMLIRPLAAAGMALVALSACAPPDSKQHTEREVTAEFNQELHDRLPEDIRSSGVVSVAGEANQPWRLVNSTGDVSGFQVDLLEEFSTILGVNFRSDMVSGLPGVKLGIQSGRNDVGFGPLLSSEATREELAFIEYTVGRPSFVFPADGDGMDAVTDLCGKTLAHLEGSVAMDKAVERINQECETLEAPAVRTLPLVDINAVILALESDRAEYGGMGAHQAAYTESTNPDKFGKYISTEEEFTSDRLGMGFDPSDAELAEVLFEAWKIVFDTGTYDELMDHYNMQDIKIDEPTLRLDAAEQ